MTNTASTDKLIEIERKRKVDENINELVNRISDLGFKEHAELTEIDTYYSRPDVDYMKTVECLRVRERDGFTEVTYKPATSSSTNMGDGVIAKVETNLHIKNPQDAGIAKQLLANIGMIELTEVNKRRKTYVSDSYKNLSIAIDDIKGAGIFIEVEVMSSDKEDALMQIQKVEQQLSISNYPIVTKPYRDICMGLA